MTADQPAEPPALPRKAALAFVLAAVLLPLGLALWTDHTWEDFFITFRHSRNLCEGHGLVYQPGERVHGFTSPLGVLLPAFGYWITGGPSYVGALWVLRVVGLVALAGAGLLLLQTAARHGATPWALFFLAILYLFDMKTAAFSINGMETAFMLLFVIWGFSLAVKGISQHWLATGICWAGLMWTRPDSCVYVAIFALLAFNFGAETARDKLLAIGKSGLVCTLLYLPWFVWTWEYYGSPVPHTIVAKSRIRAMDEARIAALNGGTAPGTFARIGQAFPNSVAAPFRPTYSERGGWPALVNWVCLALGLFCAGYWLVPGGDRLAKMASMAFFLLSVYLAYVTLLFPWYLPPVAVLGYIALVLGASDLAVRLGNAPAAVRLVPYTPVALLCVGQVALFGIGAVLADIRQVEIEEHHRIPLALWLKDHVRPGERIFVEPLGYLGYFSEAKMLDYPGLVSPEVVQAIDAGCDDFSKIGLHLRPEWMVLRPWERKAMLEHEDFAQDYAEVKVFDATPRLDEYTAIPGSPDIKFDAVFYVYHRRNEAVTSTAAGKKQ
jgi:hypothetical protein